MARQDEPSTRSTSGQLQRRSSAAPPGPWEEMDRFFENFFPRDVFRFGRGWPQWAGRLEGRLPTVDVIDRSDDILVRAEMPGVKKEDLEVSVSDNAVTIRGTARQEGETKEAQYYRRELNQAEYSRSVRLPAEVNGDQAKARFQDGILELTLPKVAPSSRRTIKVE